MSLLLEAYGRSLTHETVYPHECSPFSEVRKTYSEEDQRLISEEYLYVYDIADERKVALSIELIEELETKIIEEMTILFGRA